MKLLNPILVLIFGIVIGSCSSSDSGENPNPNPLPINDVEFWLTKPDGSVKLQKQNTIIPFGNQSNTYQTIVINDSQIFQTIDGFGYTLTGGSAQVINSLSAPKKAMLLNELFGNDENSISVSYLRISIGASDLNETPFSYDDISPGQTDVNLEHFSLAPDMENVIPLLKEILVINPNLKIIASPWSAPVWMKDNNSTIGGSLKPDYYSVYAQYFVKYIQEMKMQGIGVDAITVQNEPLHDGNNPSMYMTAVQQVDFIKNHLGPAFKNAGINTKIVIYDHNCDKPDYPISVLNDLEAKKFIDGSAFHLYAGDISAMTLVHNTHPDKNLYFTEQYTASNGNFGEDLKWHIQNVIIGSMRNWSKVALEWNLANNDNFGPHTQGGCTVCKGAITVNGSENFYKNVSYYIIAHASKFVSPASARINSNNLPNLPNVTFKTPDGKNVMVTVNTGLNTEIFNVKFQNKWFTGALNPGEVATYVW